MSEHGQDASPAATISNAMAKLVADTTGRGPMNAQTTIARDHILVMLSETLTKGERNLVAAGFGEEVLHIRRRYQEIMRPEATALIENVVGRRVVGFMSENHLEPDLAAEVFVLGPRPSLDEAA